MPGFILDVETNGIILPSVVHCGVLINIDTADIHQYANQPGYKSLDEFVADASNADCLIGHNIASYDIPQMRRLLDAKIDNRKLHDTLHATRVLWPDLREQDREKGMPNELVGRHSLKAWGVRLGELKGDFGETTDWQAWSPGMMQYCVQDCITNFALYCYILEHDI
jgi:DNA polymerase-1